MSDFLEQKFTIYEPEKFDGHEDYESIFICMLANLRETEYRLTTYLYDINNNNIIGNLTMCNDDYTYGVMYNKFIDALGMQAITAPTGKIFKLSNKYV